MRIHDPNTEGEEPFNLVPLTDMVFNLLIFFMCATTFAQIEKDLSVQLPQASSSFKPLSAAPEQLIINVKEDGSATVSVVAYCTLPSAPVTLAVTMSPAASFFPLSRTAQSMSGASAWLRPMT